MDKYAVLILAHSDPAQLRRLIYSLDSEYFDIFVHVDKKIDISQFCFQEYTLRHSELHVLDNRVKVYWGDISIVTATLNMYKAAFNRKRYARFITLSGLDYPLLSNSDIFNAFSDPNIEYIMGHPLEDKGKHKVQRLYFMHSRLLNRVFGFIYNKLHINLGHAVFHSPAGEPWNFYFAPQWHALSYEFVKYMLSFVDENPYYLRRFKHTYAPDELMIPTLLFNSEFKSHALRTDFPPNVHYNFKTAIHCLNYEPIIEVFDENSFDMIINSGKCFTRKLCSGKSETLIEMIDAHRAE